MTWASLRSFETAWPAASTLVLDDFFSLLGSPSSRFDAKNVARLCDMHGDPPTAFSGRRVT